MKRRPWLLSMGAIALAAGGASLRAVAQTARVPARIALLTVTTEAAFTGSLRGIRAGLIDNHLVEGRDVTIDIRYGNGRDQELPRLAADLASGAPAVFIATGKQATDAVLAASADVPVVSLGDLVAAGHADRLGRPSGRVTGVSFLPAPLNVKRLELLAELLPKGRAFMNLADPRPLPGTMEAVEAAGRSLGLTLYATHARSPAEIERAFRRARELAVAGVNVLNSPFLSSEHARIVRLSAATRMPAIYQWPETAREGGLIGYGPSLVGMFRQLAGFAARIARGARPGDLPIEQPTRFDLVINARTAREMNVAVPSALLLRADEVVH